MKHKTPDRTDWTRGLTLVEMTVACVLMVVVFGAGLGISIESRDVWSHIYQDTTALQSTRETLHLLGAELATSKANRVTISEGEDSDVLLFQVPLGLEDDDIVWGADAQKDAFIRVSVEDGRLLRQVVDEAGQVVGRTRVLALKVDSLYEEQKGFAVALNDGFCSITLRIRAEQSGHAWRRQVTSGVLLRN